MEFKRPHTGFEGEICPLSNEHLQVLYLASIGLTAVKIAKRLNITKHAVHSRVKKALSITGTDSTIELVCIAIREGWID